MSLVPLGRRLPLVGSPGLAALLEQNVGAECSLPGREAGHPGGPSRKSVWKRRQENRHRRREDMTERVTCKEEGIGEDDQKSNKIKCQ